MDRSELLRPVEVLKVLVGVIDQHEEIDIRSLHGSLSGIGADQGNRLDGWLSGCPTGEGVDEILDLLGLRISMLKRVRRSVEV